MRIVRAVDAKRQFSNLLKQVSQGEKFLVISGGRPVATIAPVTKVNGSRLAARSMLLERLRSQKLHQEIASYASQAAGTGADLDGKLEAAGMEHLLDI